MKEQNIVLFSTKKTIKIEDFSDLMMETKSLKCKPSEKLSMDQTNKEKS